MYHVHSQHTFEHLHTCTTNTVLVSLNIITYIQYCIADFFFPLVPASLAKWGQTE